VLELRTRTGDDQPLIAAFRSGDDAAFGQIFERHHDVLLRYARRVLGRSSEHAEDVVQEAMFRASRALRRDERHIELRPWLFRLVRNCALDELARVRTDSVALDDADDWGMLQASAATQPEVASEQRGKLRDLLGDISALPAPQRHALLRREVDGISHAALASELGVSEQATKNLVHRARANLVKHEEARSTDCQDVRLGLLEAHDEGRRASAATYRHVATCRECRTFRGGLKTTSRAVAMLVPGPLLLVAVGLVAGKIGAAGAKGAMLKTGATVAAGAALATGVVVGGLEVFGPGDPAPQSAKSLALPAGYIGKGTPLPARTSVIRRTVRFPAGAPRSATVTLACRSGLRVADLLTLPGAGAEYAAGTSIGATRTVRVLVHPRPGASWTRVSVLCRAPDARGSLVARSPLSAGGAAGRPIRHVRVERSELLVRPHGAALGSVHFAQPVQPLGRATTGGWQRIRTDAGDTGWVRTAVLGPP
jgi:RNA polymerase sigma factor (sigma-70 family)